MIRKRTLLSTLAALLFTTGVTFAQAQNCPRANCPNAGQNCPRNGQGMRQGRGAMRGPAAMSNRGGMQRGRGMMSGTCAAPAAQATPPAAQETKK